MKSLNLTVYKQVDTLKEFVLWYNYHSTMVGVKVNASQCYPLPDGKYDCVLFTKQTMSDDNVDKMESVIQSMYKGDTKSTKDVKLVLE